MSYNSEEAALGALPGLSGRGERIVRARAAVASGLSGPERPWRADCEERTIEEPPERKIQERTIEEPPERKIQERTIEEPPERKIQERTIEEPLERKIRRVKITGPAPIRARS